MNAAQILNHFNRISEAPDAIPRLRRFILDLAVCGKLVEQDPNDEPVSELLKRINEEKAKLLKSSKVRDKKSQPKTKLTANFDIPRTWQWVLLGQITKFWNGFAFKSSDFQNQGVPVIRIGDLQNGEVCTNSAVRVTQEIANLVPPETWIPKNALLIAMSGATTGKVAINNTETELLLNQRVGRIQVFQVSLKFVRFFFETIVAYNLAISFGTAIPNLSTEQIITTVFPLPPLMEQHRIVAKVDELMALCDQLKASHTERENRRDRLTAASLNRLNNGDNAESFRKDAAFFIQNLSRLATRPEHIEGFRKTILNLAVRGKLVPQDPNDEPAIELLAKIIRTKNSSISNKMAKTKEFQPVVSADLPLNIPTGWVAARLGIAYDVRDGTHDTPKYVSSGYPLVTSKNLCSGHLLFDNVKFISEKDHNEISKRSGVDQGDVLFAMIGSIGNPVIVNTNRPFSIKNVALFKYYDQNLSCPGFLRLFLQHAENSMRQIASGGLQPFVSLGFLRKFTICLPPLAEQHRIVAKADELMALCDQLEAQLSRTQNESRRLLEALLHEALNAG